MEKIGARETKWLFFLLMISGICFDELNFLINKFATGAYIALGLVTLLAVLSVYITERLMGEEDIFTAITTAWGRWGALVFWVVLFLVTVLNASVRMKDFAHVTGKVLLPESPPIFTLFFISGAAFAVAFLKLEAISRYALVAAAVFMAFVSVIIFTASGEAEFLNVFPLMGKGNYLKSLPYVYIFSDIVYFWVISSHIRKNSQKKHMPVKSVALTGAVGLVILIFYMLCVPYPASGDYVYPLRRLSMLANSSVVFQRLDGLVFLIWIFLGFISAGALCLFAVMVLSQNLRLKNQSAMCFFAVVMSLTFALWNVDFKSFLRPLMSAISFLFLPLTALLYKIKRRVGNEE